MAYACARILSISFSSSSQGPLRSRQLLFVTHLAASAAFQYNTRIHTAAAVLPVRAGTETLRTRCLARHGSGSKLYNVDLDRGRHRTESRARGINLETLPPKATYVLSRSVHLRLTVGGRGVYEKENPSIWVGGRFKLGGEGPFTSLLSGTQSLARSQWQIGKSAREWVVRPPTGALPYRAI